MVQIEPGPDAHLDGVGARVDERLGALAGGDVAADHVDVREGGVGLEPADDVEHARALAVGGVDHEHVDARVAQGLGTLPRVAEEAHRGADAQAALGVLRGVRVLLGLVEVLDGDEAGEAAGLVDEGQLLDLVLREDRDRLVGVHADPAGDERHARHDLADARRALLEVGDEAHVAVRDDAHEDAVVVDHREAAHAVRARRARRPRRRWRRASW